MTNKIYYGNGYKIMNYTGNLQKMAVALAEPNQATYGLRLNEETVALNQYLGQNIQLRHTGKINCVHCGNLIKKAYQQGYCFPCTQKLAQCDFCILKPERCHDHKGTCREPEWAKTHCMQPHIVYLANTSGLKVGITREDQIPTRWIDQGAIQALPIIRVQSRYQSGLMEQAFAQLIADKTNWRKMLQPKIEAIDLKQQRNHLLPELASQIQKIAGQFSIGDIELLTAEEVVDIDYPVLQFPDKLTTFNFDKQPLINSILQGIKGQYLIFKDGVINIRSFSGYEVEFSL